MGIEISNTESLPAVTYNKIFLKNLKITQESEDKDTATPVYALTLEYTIYGVDENNKRYFKPKVKIIQIDDYIALAMQKAGEGDMDLLVAMQAIEHAVATILEDQTELGTATVVS